MKRKTNITVNHLGGLSGCHLRSLQCLVIPVSFCWGRGITQPNPSVCEPGPAGDQFDHCDPSGADVSKVSPTSKLNPATPLNEKTTDRLTVLHYRRFHLYFDSLRVTIEVGVVERGTVPA